MPDSQQLDSEQPTKIADYQAATPQATKDFLAIARERFRLCVDGENKFRMQALDDLRFLVGNQWPVETKEQRKEENRPCMTINRMPAIKSQIVNEQRAQRPSAVIKPVGSDGDWFADRAREEAKSLVSGGQSATAREPEPEPEVKVEEPEPEAEADVFGPEPETDPVSLVEDFARMQKAIAALDAKLTAERETREAEAQERQAESDAYAERQHLEAQQAEPEAAYAWMPTGPVDPSVWDQSNEAEAGL